MPCLVFVFENIENTIFLFFENSSCHHKLVFCVIHNKKQLKPNEFSTFSLLFCALFFLNLFLLLFESILRILSSI